ncbi:MAG: hypothetical protein GX751_01205, partial [Desulfuromonadaceae bacterium]|nr:hypothetical protein [Desulfuromonadaceae bacterium]
LPNLFLASHPVKVTPSSEPLVAAEITVGNRIPRERVEDLLIGAAERVPLQEISVHILRLGKSSVTFRVGGRFSETGEVPAARSRLNALILDACQNEDIDWVFQDKGSH